MHANGQVAQLRLEKAAANGEARKARTLLQEARDEARLYRWACRGLASVLALSWLAFIYMGLG